jgi:hypothetical protein
VRVISKGFFSIFVCENLEETTTSGVLHSYSTIWIMTMMFLVGVQMDGAREKENGERREREREKGKERGTR